MFPSPHCLECDQAIKGRSDKKFCDDQCRARYHNRLNGDDNNLIRRINYALRRNHRILSSLAGEGKRTIRRSCLVRKGFDFEIITAIQLRKSGNPCFYCYEYGYMPLDEDRFQLVRHIPD